MRTDQYRKWYWMAIARCSHAPFVMCKNNRALVIIDLRFPRFIYLPASV